MDLKEYTQLLKHNKYKLYKHMGIFMQIQLKKLSTWHY